jgi:hypothetical protein
LASHSMRPAQATRQCQVQLAVCDTIVLPERVYRAASTLLAVACSLTCVCDAYQ